MILKCSDHPESAIDNLVFDNPLAFWRMSNRWQEWPVEEMESKKKATHILLPPILWKD